MAKVHIIPHTHWDREWYFSVEDSLVLLSYNLDKILDTLENNKRFPAFLLDGQASLIEDYLKIKPENKNRIEKLIKEKKLFIGPWYTQTDEMVVAGESIIRNLLYGTRISSEFGGYMPIGYLPDSFGQSSQMPEIFKGFDIDSVILWRGVCNLDTKKTEFYWESPSGAKVFVLQLRFGYGDGKHLTLENFNEKFKIINELKKLTDTGNIVLPNGGDQVPIQSNLDSIVDEINNIDKNNEYVISNYDTVIKELKQSGVNFNVLRGEFTKPKTMRIHKSIFSSRYDLKKLNSDAENKLTTAVEPIYTMAYNLGFEYPKGLIDRAWKLILENQAHDSIGGCNSDSTNEDIKNRAKKSHEIIDGVLNVIVKKLANSIDASQEGSKLILFNTLHYERSMIIEYEIATQQKEFSLIKGNKRVEYTLVSQQEIKGGVYTYMTSEGEQSGTLPNYYISKVYIKAEKLPPLGYDTYYIKEQENSCDKLITCEDEFIENDYYKVIVKLDGSVSIYDKLNNITLDKCLIYEDSGNDGDEYNYSPPKNDLIISSENYYMVSFKIYKSQNVEKIIINTILKAPSSLEQRNKGIIDGEVLIKTEILLNKLSQYIHFNVEVNNKIKDHKLRVLFNTGIKSEYSYSDNQFGLIRRDISLQSELEDYNKKQWRELPINIEPMLSMVELNDENYGVALLTNGIKEYQVIGDNNDTLALTLLSSVGVLGKDDLLWRPGRASGINNTTVYTPDAQLLGKSCYEFALYVHNGNINESRAPHLAKELNNYNVAYQQQNLSTLKYRLDRFELPSENIIAPESFSLFELDKHIILSAVKLQENGEGYIIRAFNPYLNKTKETIIYKNKNIVLRETNLAEKEIGSEKIGKTINLGEFNPCEVRSFKILE